MNEKIISEFKKLIDQIKYDMDHAINKQDALKHSFRLRQVQNVIKILEKYPKEIKSGEELKEIKGVGKGTISRINEILEKGRLSEIRTEKKYKQYIEYIEDLEQVIGIGRKTAYELVTDHNIKSVEQLKKAYNDGLIDLNDQIVLGLKYHGVYKKKIPREEINKINKHVKKIGDKVSKNLKITIAGSYRRKKPVSNDIDMLIAHPRVKTRLDIKKYDNYLRKFVKQLKEDNFLVDDLTYEDYETKYMGFGRLDEKHPIRRVDIRYVPFDSYPAALLYFTGSGEFNRKMRGVAIELGYKLNEYGLFKVTNNVKIPVKSEKEIFEKLGMEYLPPEKR